MASVCCFIASSTAQAVEWWTFFSIALSTFNAAEAGDPAGGIALDAERAVRTIAASLSKDPRTLQAVRRADDRVGESFLDEDLQDRIASAERSSTYPWQFCFILGGGWRRAAQVIATCKSEATAIPLAGIALLQLVTRDRPAEISQLEELLSPSGIAGPALRTAVQSLIGRRLVLSANDLRTPHQRFAVALLVAMGRSATPSDRDVLHEMCRLAVTHSCSTLAGVRLLMSELRFGDHWMEPRFWSAPVMEALRKRCFDAQTPEDRMYAANWLAEQHGPPWSSWAFIDDDRIALFGRWITEVQHPTGYGLHSLLNNIYNGDPALMARIVLASDPRSVAGAASSISLFTAGSTYALVDRTALARSDDWSRTFVAALDREQLFRELSSWTDLERGVHVASSVCWALALHDEKLAWDVLAAVTPLLQKAFASDPVRAFRGADEIVGSFLRVWDPLGLWKGPSKRQRLAVTELLADVETERLAMQLSRCSWRELHAASHFLGFLLAADRKKASSLLSAVDLDRVAEGIGDRWKALDHESATFLLQFARDKKNLPRIQQLLLARSSEIKTLPAKLAIVAPSVAVSVLSAGGRVDLSSGMGLDWQVVALAVYHVGRFAPGQLREMLAPHLANAAKGWQSSQVNLYEHVDMFVALLEQFGLQDVIQQILEQGDRATMEIVWAKVLREGGASARSVAFLVEHALLSQDTDIRTMALRIRKRLPSSSKPTEAARKRYLMD